MPFNPLVHVSDSSKHGYALMYKEFPISDVWEACSWQERWRFLDVYDNPVDADFSSDAINDLNGLSRRFDIDTESAVGT